MKKHPSLKSTGIALGLLLCSSALQADVVVPLSSTWGEYDYNRYLYGAGNGNLTLSGQSSSGFTALVTSNFVDVVANGSGAIGPDGQAEGPQGRPAVFQEFQALDLSRPGQKVTLSFDIQFHNVMKVTDKRFRFGLCSTNSNSTVYLMVDTGVAAGGSAQFRPDPYLTDVTGNTLWDFTSTPSFPWAYTANGYSTSPTLTNVNNPLEPLGPNTGYVSGILSHFASSGGNSQNPAMSGAPNGAINGLGADASTLGIVHSFKYSFQRTNDGSGAMTVNAGNGLTLSASWSNTVGPDVLSSTVPLYNDHAEIPANGGPLDSIGLVAFNFMDNDIYTNGAAGGSYTMSNVKIVYESLKIVEARNSAPDTVQLIWTSTPSDVPTAQYEIESTGDLTEPVTWLPAATPIASQGDFTTNTVPAISATGDRQFYRVRKL